MRVCLNSQVFLFPRVLTMATFLIFLGMPQKVAFHPSDICIAVALTNKTIKLYDLRLNKQLQLYKCHEKEVNSVEFHPCGNYLYSVSGDSTLKVITAISISSKRETIFYLTMFILGNRFIRRTPHLYSQRSRRICTFHNGIKRW
mgnify:FL=1